MTSADGAKAGGLAPCGSAEGHASRVGTCHDAMVLSLRSSSRITRLI